MPDTYFDVPVGKGWQVAELRSRNAPTRQSGGDDGWDDAGVGEDDRDAGVGVCVGNTGIVGGDAFVGVCMDGTGVVEIESGTGVVAGNMG